MSILLQLRLLLLGTSTPTTYVGTTILFNFIHFLSRCSKNALYVRWSLIRKLNQNCFKRQKSYGGGKIWQIKVKIIDRKRHLFVQNWIILNNSSLLGVKIKNLLLQFFAESDFRNIKTTDRDEKSFVFLVKKFLCQLIGFQ